MQIPSLLGHCTELIRIIRKSPQPADLVVREYMRSKKYIGASDRRFISTHTFHTLRILSLAEAHAQRLDIADVAQAAYELDLADTWITSLPLHVQVCTQEWLLESTVLRWTDAPLVWKSMMSSAPVGLRVSLRRANRTDVVNELSAQGISALASPLTESGIVVTERINILQHPLYLNGVIEIQDVGSALVSLATQVRPGMRVLDACAGAGGKTMHMADMMNDRGTIVARDIEWQRLKEIPKRARRTGITIVETELSKPNTSLQAEQFDVVLIDAPCSGMGTVRRSPMVKWRLTPELLRRHTAKQLTLLKRYSTEACVGGTVVYATCSILPEENEQVTQRFLLESPMFEFDAEAQMDPLHTGTDGLYWARFKRVE